MSVPMNEQSFRAIQNSLEASNRALIKLESQRDALLEALEKVEKITRFVDAWENRMEEIRIISAAAIAEAKE